MQSLSRRVSVSAIALLGALTVGCTAAEPESAPVAETPHTTPATSAEATPTPSAAPAPTPTTDLGGCESRTKLGFLTGGDEAGRWVYWTGPQLQDRGATSGARGSVATDDGGRLLSYVVADGDGAYEISDRFCIDIISFTTYSDQHWLKLDPGDVLRLAIEPADLFEVD
ncbi:hypothetical protein JF550_10630 [Microbacterium esteraromaticum]|uniref:Lipoprotein n=1 Tax=Microbacterium esteraromaticum TaxID=57043 RepID=A0A939ITM7_9MICO|nr:hypothetical protein [Microbacterium esteraromaticum]MBN8206407.1 hypothetical protein [Microbacterium esteraromaticum]MBN8416562.1 hypothetical protein [Microbacterium esteraromaticum]